MRQVRRSSRSSPQDRLARGCQSSGVTFGHLRQKPSDAGSVHHIWASREPELRITKTRLAGRRFAMGSG